MQRFRIFLSTPSARRATSQAYFSFRRCIISIHALREEGDVTDLGQIKLPYRISIHALREEGDVTDLGQIKLPYRISIHALREEGDVPAGTRLC